MDSDLGLDDAMPILFMQYPEKFTVKEIPISVDRYGATVQDANKKNIHVAVGADNALLFDTLTQIFMKNP